jgi:hypothetical protein
METLQQKVWGLQQMIESLGVRVDEEQKARVSLELEVNQLKRREEKSSSDKKEDRRDDRHGKEQQRRSNEGEAAKKQSEQQANERAEAEAAKRQKLEKKQQREKKEKEAKKQRALVLKEREERDQKTVFLNQTVVGGESSQLVMAMLRNAGLVRKDGSVQGNRGLQEVADQSIERVDEPEIGWARVVFLSKEIAKGVMQRFRDGKEQKARALGHIQMWSAEEWFKKGRRAHAQAERKDGNRRRDGSGRGICFRFRDHGRCNFEARSGTRCKFEHRDSSQ